MKSLLDYLPEFLRAFGEQIKSDNDRWGDTWKKRTREGQEERVKARFRDYFDQFENGGTPVPWLKVAGEAFIAWVREQHSDYAER